MHPVRGHVIFRKDIKMENQPKKQPVPRQKMPEQDPKQRRHNFNEVPLGFSEETAKLEASRCLQCKKPQCVAGCPVEVNIPAFIGLIKNGDYLGAAKKIKETNALPAVCGRVCPQEDQCEKNCILTKKGESVGIGRLERFAADYARCHGEISIPQLPPPTGKKVAVVGSGPAGLTCAGDLAKMGHSVTLFEALHLPGGVLVYGIPEFRLPKAIVASEVDYLLKIGVKLEVDCIVGRTRTVDDLFEDGYSAIFLGVGAGLPKFMNIPGENLLGVYSANEYLTRINLMKAYQFPETDTPIIKGKNVIVVGGGNVAMDSVRNALRLGAEKACIVYRRSLEEMPARKEEVHHAEQEGVQFDLLCNPTRIIGNDKGFVSGIEIQKMELGAPDASGRRSPVPIKGSEYVIPADTVVMSLGTNAQPLIATTTNNLNLNKWGYIVADENTGATSKAGVYAGGDIVTGSATVILAMGAGKKAARAMNDYLKTI